LVPVDRAVGDGAGGGGAVELEEFVVGVVDGGVDVVIDVAEVDALDIV
jgi:hypothetical protein